MRHRDQSAGELRGGENHRDADRLIANAQFPIANTDQEQVALAVIGGYRGRFPWPAGVGSGSEHNGLFVAANYKYLREFAYGNQSRLVALSRQGEVARARA